LYGVQGREQKLGTLGGGLKRQKQKEGAQKCCVHGKYD
jgi:hypothetical protein